uniref:S8 family serine peptidase n=2 Tax=Litorilinea aerophila TaxID=1204385 RepID=A0A540VDF0_9CHLR
MQDRRIHVTMIHAPSKSGQHGLTAALNLLKGVQPMIHSQIAVLSGGKSWGNAIRWAIMLALILSSVLVAPSPVAANKIQPALLELVNRQPGSTLPIIVQKAGVNQEIESWIRQQGGVITKELPIINAFAAELAGEAVPLLAELPDVRWISLDASVESRGVVENRFYLYASSNGNTPAQPILPLRQEVPSGTTLFNYDTDRDNAPGLLIRRGGDLDASAGSDQIQYWRTPPLASAQILQGNVTLRVYAAIPPDQTLDPNAEVRIQAALFHVDEAGNRVATIARGERAKSNWTHRWQRVTLSFPPVSYILPAHHRLELALTVDGRSANDLVFAFGTRQLASYVSARLANNYLQASSFYLYNDPVANQGDTSSHPILPLAPEEPSDSPLYNYDADRDSGPGLRIRRLDAPGGPLSPDQIQRWRLPTLSTTVQVAAGASLELWVTRPEDSPGQRVQLQATLNQIDSTGRTVQTLAATSAATNLDNGWKKFKFAFNNGPFVIPAGDQLELAVTLDGASEGDVWLAFGTRQYPARLDATLAPLLPHTYLKTIGALEAWEHGYQGQGVRVAVVDSGIWQMAPDLARPDGAGSRVIASYSPVGAVADEYGHGTYVAGIIGSNGAASGGYYRGVAPQAELLNVRVSDQWGASRESDVIAGLQWILDHKDAYNIRVVNLSLNSTVGADSYHNSPLNAAVEILWFNGIVVVVAGGNNGSREPVEVFPPANDPFVIAVGAAEDQGTIDPTDDAIAPFSAFGVTPDGVTRPDLIAPGAYIVSSLAEGSNFDRYFQDYQATYLDPGGHGTRTGFVASGTSVASAVVAGAAALLLQAQPDLNPDQVKYLLTASATPLPGEPGAGAGIINVARALELLRNYGSGAAVPTTNNTYQPSQLLSTGSEPVDWTSVNWNSVNWNSVNWNSVNWNSVNWNSVNWNSTSPQDPQMQEEPGTDSSPEPADVASDGQGLSVNNRPSLNETNPVLAPPLFWEQVSLPGPESTDQTIQGPEPQDSPTGPDAAPAPQDPADEEPAVEEPVAEEPTPAEEEPVAEEPAPTEEEPVAEPPQEEAPADPGQEPTAPEAPAPDSQPPAEQSPDAPEEPAEPTNGQPVNPEGPAGPSQNHQIFLPVIQQ